MGDFSKLGLKKGVIETLNSLGLTKSFEVQDRVVPAAAKGSNIVFTSRTGSGKTLAYLLGFLGRIDSRQGLQMMVIVPTRELCMQVGKEIATVCDPLGIVSGMLFGGRDVKGDYRTLNRKNQIIVGTPGRMIEHINSKALKVGDVKYLVYDESDQMFDQGFYDECAYMRKRVSKNAQIILASATMTDKVKLFVDEKIAEYEMLTIGAAIPEGIIQEKVFCPIAEKPEVLLAFFTKRKFHRVLVFCNTKRNTYDLSELLKQKGFKSLPLNSALEQSERQNHLELFRTGSAQILVATDVAARGLHIEKVDAVVNYDIPTRFEFYIHRIGRTGRVGREGYSLSLICPQDRDRFHNIEFEYELDVKELDKGLNPVTRRAVIKDVDVDTIIPED